MTHVDILQPPEKLARDEIWHAQLFISPLDHVKLEFFNMPEQHNVHLKLANPISPVSGSAQIEDVLFYAQIQLQENMKHKYQPATRIAHGSTTKSSSLVHL